MQTHPEWENEVDDYAGGQRPHGYPSYRGYVKLCPDDCPHCDCGWSNIFNNELS